MPGRYRCGGLDGLRLLAMLLVSLQHVFTLTWHYEWVHYRSLNLGQAGVALFIAISGLLAGTSTRRPWSWLWHRLLRLYPAYWLVMGVSFALAWVTGYKHFGPGQFVSQMLGMGLFTHGRHLVNVPTWFVSLLLACYGAQFLLRLSPWPRASQALWALLLALWTCNSHSVGQIVHVPTFFIASALAVLCPPSWRALAFLTAGAAFLLRTPWAGAAAYPGLALLAVGVALVVPRPSTLAAQLSNYSYEFYLVHGIALVVALHLFPAKPALAMALGMGMAGLGAVLVQRTVARAGCWISRPTSSR